MPEPIIDNLNQLKVTDKNGNVYVLLPVDTEARQEIEEAKNLQFDSSFFTAEEDSVNGEVNIGLNGAKIGVDETLRFVEDTATHITFGINSSLSDAGKVLTVDNTGNAVWGNAPEELPASTSSDEGKLLAVNSQGSPEWASLDKSSWGTVITDGNNALADENGNLIFDENETELWTSFNNVGFGAERAIADREGNIIDETYAKTSDVTAALGNIETLLAAI